MEQRRLQLSKCGEDVPLSPSPITLPVLLHTYDDCMKSPDMVVVWLVPGEMSKSWDAYLAEWQIATIPLRTSAQCSALA